MTSKVALGSMVAPGQLQLHQRGHPPHSIHMPNIHIPMILPYLQVRKGKILTTKFTHQGEEHSTHYYLH